MVRIRLVCPCSFRFLSSSNRPPVLRRGSSLNPPSTSHQNFATNLMGITLILFVITTYLVLSLDTLMLMDAQPAEAQQAQRRDLVETPLPKVLRQNDHTPPIRLIVLDDDEQPLASLPSFSPTEEDFAESLNALNLSLLEDEDDEERHHELFDDVAEEVPEATPSLIVPDWKRIHVCKEGSSFNTAVWAAKHRKLAVLGDGYTKTPTETKLRHLKIALELMREFDVKNALSEADRAGYTLCKMELDTSVIIAWQPRTKGDAMIFVRYGEVSNIVVEIPHSMFDHTLLQGLIVFEETRARALLLSTSHRCSRSLLNACTGNEGEPIRNVCGGVRLGNHNADAAHAVQTMFHFAHEQLSVDYASALFVSLHSTKAEEFIVSDGTSSVLPLSSPLWRFAKTLASKHVADQEESHSVLVSVCNTPQEDTASPWGLNLALVSEEKSNLCGATNVQGRHLNGAGDDACKVVIPRNGTGLVSSHRFIHVEQPVHMLLPLDLEATKSLSESILAAGARANDRI